MPHIIVVTFAADVMPALKERRFRLLASPETDTAMLAGMLRPAVIPVSYTHLDVYKRQSFHHPELYAHPVCG